MQYWNTVRGTAKNRTYMDLIYACLSDSNSRPPSISDVLNIKSNTSGPNVSCRDNGLSIRRLHKMLSPSNNTRLLTCVTTREITHAHHTVSLHVVTHTDALDSDDHNDEQDTKVSMSPGTETCEVYLLVSRVGVALVPFGYALFFRCRYRLSIVPHSNTHGVTFIQLTLNHFRTVSVYSFLKNTILYHVRVENTFVTLSTAMLRCLRVRFTYRSM